MRRVRPSRMRAAALAACLLLPPSGAAVQSDPRALAQAFGTLPNMYAARLSPSGDRIVYLSQVEHDHPFAVVLDMASARQQVVLASRPDKFDLRWCGWANDETLLCGFYGIDFARGEPFPVTRLVAARADGGGSRVLLQDRLARQRVMGQFQDDIVDWLPDDPAHILVEVPGRRGTGVSRVNIETGRASIVERARDNVREWRSDGRGRPRLRQRVTREEVTWHYRLADDAQWRPLREYRYDEDVDYLPVGFGEERNTLLVYRPHLGRLALWAEDLTGAAPPRVVAAHPEVDIQAVSRLGRYRRLAGAVFATDGYEFQFFDDDVAAVVEAVRAARPGMHVAVVDESWDRRSYLLHLRSPQDPGRYYRLDREERRLQALWPTRPALADRRLGPVTPFRYRARDGVAIPAYLTLPARGGRRDLPVVVMPHGGPESRDYLEFDFLAQYLAARGFAVLQSNFRGSGGYGSAWAGEGGFKAWRRVVDDLTDGLDHLARGGVADPDRACILGWSYGGYAALMSAIEGPDRYRCVVSIAGVTDPMRLIRERRNFLSGKRVEAFVGTDAEVIQAGSPLRRADALQVPVLMFHGDEDINVDPDHSRRLHKALRRAGGQSELVLYEDAEHGIWRTAYRIDMLERIGRFLAHHGGD